jgi:hypothetical protein
MGHYSPVGVRNRNHRTPRGLRKLRASFGEATEAIKDTPQFRFSWEARPTVRSSDRRKMVSDLKCTKFGDAHYACDVLMRKNPVTGGPQTASADFVKLWGKWRSTATY